MNETIDIWWHLTNLLGWIGLGGIVGFVYAHRRVKREQQEIIARNDDLLQTPGQTRGHFQGALFGLRLGAGLSFAIVGAVAGVAIWTIATAAMLLLN